MSEIEFPSTFKYFGMNTFTNTKWLSDRQSENPLVTINNVIVDGTNVTGTVTIPEGIEKIGDIAFSNNKNITSVTFPNSLNEIGYSSFESCTSLTNVNEGNNINKIGNYAFDGCNNLTTFNYPSGLKEICDDAFYNCKKLQNINLPEGLEKIGQHAFYGTTGFTGSTITITASVKVIGNEKYPSSIFYDCGGNSFTTFEVENGNQNYKAEDGILYSKDGSILVAIPNGKTFTDNVYTMPDTVKLLGELSFGTNRNISKVIISDNLIIESSVTSDEVGAGWSQVTSNTNQLFRAIYVYNNIKLFDVKDTNNNYTSGIKVLSQTHEFGSEDNQGYLLTKDGSELVAVPPHCIGYQMLPVCVTSIRENAFLINMNNGLNFASIAGIYSEIYFRINKNTTEIEHNQLDYINFLARDTNNRSKMNLQISGENNPKYKIVDNQFVLK